MKNRVSKKKRKKKHHPSTKVTPSRTIRAIVDTGGIIRRIAENLDCSYVAVYRKLRNGKGRQWDAVREAYRLECERITDTAELTILELIQQRQDLGVAERAAKWYLSKKRDVFRDKKDINIGGTGEPIQIESKVQVDLSKLPLEMRRQLLAAMEDTDE